MITYHHELVQYLLLRISCSVVSFLCLCNRVFSNVLVYKFHLLSGCVTCVCLSSVQDKLSDALHIVCLLIT